VKDYSLEEFQAEFPTLFNNDYMNDWGGCMFDLPRGWGEIVRKGCEKLAKLDTCRIHVHQVKEKFGGLRFYFHEERLPPSPKYLANEEGWSSPEEGWVYSLENHERWIEEIVSAMEHASFWVCQDCGTTQNVDTRGGWILTLCESCREIHYK
jgi:hypothetical protein